MAISFARLAFIKRSAGKNIVAKAAYNSRSKLRFEGNIILPQKSYDWSYNSKPIMHAIILPDHVEKDFLNPEFLWNTVERFEKRKDSQVGFELLLALPDDKIISDSDRQELSEKFVRKFFISKGYGAQIDIHPPNLHKSYNEETGELEENEKNTHAHILITPRHFSSDGKSFLTKKINDILPEIRGANHQAFGGLEWSDIWMQFQNEYFEEKGIDLRVDPKGVIPQIHLGPIRMRGKNAYKILDAHEERSEFITLQSQDPKIILQTLTENKSVFLESDLETFLQKNIPEEIRNQVRESFWKNSEVIQLYDEKSHQVISKFTSASVLEEEKKILRLADRIQKNGSLLAKKYGELSNLSMEQKNAFFKVINGRSLECIEGLAGTGKSFLLVAVKEHYEKNNYKVRAFGPDNATVKVLKEKGFTEVRNVHSFLFKNYYSHKKSITPRKEVWIIDESSKLGNRPLLELLKLAEKNNVQLIFSGNSAQLSSVERGGMFQIFSNRYGHSFLSEIQRQHKNEHREISKELAFGNLSKAIEKIYETGGFTWCASKEEVLLRTVEKWAEDRVRFPFSSNLIIAHTNNEVRLINDLVHSIRIQRKEISENEFECHTIFGKVRISEGDFLEFRDNNKRLKITNGQKGILIKANKDKFIVASEGREIAFNPNVFTSFQLSYASTCFRSQGSTVDRSYIVYNPLMCQKLLYVAESRHVRNAHCFISKEDASCLMDVKRQVARKKESENTFNYTTLGDIEKIKNDLQAEKKLEEFCNSESLFKRTKGYGYKALNLFKSSLGSIIEKINDNKLDSQFYRSSEIVRNSGNVTELKNKESFALMQIDEAKEDLNKFSNIVINKFAKLSQNKKTIYSDYFEKSAKASAFYTIVQSETASIQKDHAPSFSEWQKSCSERNQAAYEILKVKENHKRILGDKSYEILRDRASRYEQSIQPKDSIENQLKENIEELLYKIFPDGPQRKDSKGFRFGSKGSIAVTCVGEKKGCFHDFENKIGGGLLKLIQTKENLNYQEAISWAKNFLNKEVKTKFIPSNFSVKQFKNVKEDKWISLSPPLNTPIPSIRSLSIYLDDNYNLKDVYPYHNEKGQCLFYMLRLEPKSGDKKIVLPLSFGKSHPSTPPCWRLKNHSDKNNVLYNGQFITEYPSRPILIVEGEKTANSAQKILGNDYVVVSWQGGASSASNAPWNLLQGKEIVIWPDNDAAGFKAASEIEKCLKQVGVKSLKVISHETLKDLPEKWDLADPIPKEKKLSFVSNSILRAENRTINIEKIKDLASNYGIDVKEFNHIVCSVEERSRSQLEKIYGSKTWEIESAILKEAISLIGEREVKVPKNDLSKQVSIQEKINQKTLEIDI